MSEERKLAVLVRRFEHHRVLPESVHQSVGKRFIQASRAVEQSDAASALAGLDDELPGSCAQPFPPSRNEVVDNARCERPSVLLAQLELDVETAIQRHFGDH